MDTAMTIAVALLVPFWWGLALLVLALLGDLVPRWRASVSRIFDRLGAAEDPVEAAAS